MAEHLELPVAEVVADVVADVIEGIALHTFEGKAPSGPETRVKIARLKAVYDLDPTAADSHFPSEQVADDATPDPR